MTGCKKGIRFPVVGGKTESLGGFDWVFSFTVPALIITRPAISSLHCRSGLACQAGSDDADVLPAFRPG